MRTLLTGDGAAILFGHLSQPFQDKGRTFIFSVFLRPSGIIPIPGIEHTTSRLSLKRSIDWVNPTAVRSFSIVGSTCNHVVT